MSELWTITCRSKKDTTVELEVRQVHPDAGALVESSVLALRMLFEAAESGDALAEALSFEDQQDDETMARRVTEFIKKCTLVVKRPSLDQDQMNEALRRSGVAEDDLEEAYQAEYSSSAAKLAGLGVFTVTATDAKWIAHLQKGRSWDSAAYFTPSAFAQAKVTSRDGDRLLLELVQRHPDAVRFPRDAAFVARMLCAGPYEYADNAPSYEELWNDTLLKPKLGGLVAGVEIDVVRPPVTVDDLARRKMAFDPEDAALIGLARYSVQLGRDLAGTDVEVGEAWDVPPRLLL